MGVNVITIISILIPFNHSIIPFQYINCGFINFRRQPFSLIEKKMSLVDRLIF